jgi:hypothetical protein
MEKRECALILETNATTENLILYFKITRLPDLDAKS